MQARDKSHVQGIDVSHYQGNIDWQQVKASGIQFVYCKASEGVTYTDPMFSALVAGAKAAGIPVGAYHFARPNQTAAIDEANHFISLLQTNQTDLLPTLDLEAPSQAGVLTPDQLVTWVRAFVEHVKQQTGKQVILYTGNWFGTLHNNFNDALSDLPLWVANYADNVPDFGGWNHWTIWQYSDKGNVPGINGAVDMNEAVSLEALGYQPKLQYPLSKEDQEYIVNRWIRSEFDLASDADKIERHRLANQLRIASGQPTQEY